MIAYHERQKVLEVYSQYSLEITEDEAIQLVCQYIGDNLKGRPVPRPYDAAHHVFSQLEKTQVRRDKPMKKTYMTRAIAFAREIKEITDCTPCDLRDVVPVLMPCFTGDGERDFTISLGGHDWRFIHMDDADAILTQELESDPYILGCFNASFIASNSDLSREIAEALQEGEKYELLGQHLIDTGCVPEMAEDYARYDGFGHHFAHYDGETHELNTEGYYAFKQG